MPNQHTKAPRLSAVVCLRLSAEMYARLRSEADSRVLTVAEVIREKLDEEAKADDLHSGLPTVHP